MNSTIMEAHAISCVLPLLALLLLAFQLIRHSGLSKFNSAAALSSTPEFPCRMGGLISISDECDPKQHRQLACAWESEGEEKVEGEKAKLDRKYLYAIGR